jgi:hypothetical protein
VVSGVKPGSRIVSKGSFFLRAERERLGVESAPVSATTPGAGRSESADSTYATLSVAVRWLDADQVQR